MCKFPCMKYGLKILNIRGIQNSGVIPNGTTVIGQTCTCDNSYHYFGITCAWHKVEAKVWYWKLTIFLRVVPLLRSEWWGLDFVNILHIPTTAFVIGCHFQGMETAPQNTSSRWKMDEHGSIRNTKTDFERFLVAVLGILEVLGELIYIDFASTFLVAICPPSSNPSRIHFKKTTPPKSMKRSGVCQLWTDVGFQKQPWKICGWNLRWSYIDYIPRNFFRMDTQIWFLPASKVLKNNGHFWFNISWGWWGIPQKYQGKMVCGSEKRNMGT